MYNYLSLITNCCTYSFDCSVSSLFASSLLFNKIGNIISTLYGLRDQLDTF